MKTRQRWSFWRRSRAGADDIAVEVLQLCDGVRSVEQMIVSLAEKYIADRGAIGADVIAMLQTLATRISYRRRAEKTAMSPTLQMPAWRPAIPLTGSRFWSSVASKAETFASRSAVLAD